MNLYKDFNIIIEGETPLIMHSDTLCNPLHPLTKDIKKITSVRLKKDEHHFAMAEIEFKAAVYYDKELGIYMPTNCLLGSFKAAARKFKLGQHIKAVIMDNAIGYPLIEYKNENTESLWNKKNEDGLQKHVYTKSVVVSRSRIMRTRALFQKWSVKFSGSLLTEILSIDQFNLIVNTAGFEAGLCELRPQKGTGSFGKFLVKSFKVEGKEYEQN